MSHFPLKASILIGLTSISATSFGEQDIYCVMQNINDPIGEKCANTVVVLPKDQIVRWCRFDQEIMPINRLADRRIGIESGVACVARAKPREPFSFSTETENSE